MARTTVHDLLAEARATLERVTPAEAHAAARDRGAVLVDIRGSEQRAEQGLVPGAVWFQRNVLEWRVDPDSDASDARVADLDSELILFCFEGYASSLAAATLQRLGFTRATDMAGGFQAWAAAGLTVERGD